jgi:hypothetical protein
MTSCRGTATVGPDTLMQRLRPIDAKDHSFGGKLDELTAELKAGVDWVG